MALQDEVSEQPLRSPEECAKIVDMLVAQLGYRYVPSRCTLESYECYSPGQKETVQRLQVFASQLINRTRRGQGVVLFGSVGTGKDHLMAALLYKAASLGLAGSWLNCQDWYGHMRDGIDKGWAESQEFRRLQAPHILALSDPVPPIGQLKEWRVEMLLRLIDSRYRAYKPTWMTVNVTSAEDAEANLSPQVWDRLQESAELVPCFWQSFRERLKR